MLTLAFFLASAAFLMQGVMVPKPPILCFAPFLALAILKAPFTRALTLSIVAGVLMDLASDDPIGLHALIFAAIVSLFFRFKSLFSSDIPFHLSLFTAVISSTFSILQLILLFLFDRRIPFDGRWFFVDCLGMSLIDALYAFVWFSAPLAACRLIYRMWVIFWLKKKKHSQHIH